MGSADEKGAPAAQETEKTISSQPETKESEEVWHNDDHDLADAEVKLQADKDAFITATKDLKGALTGWAHAHMHKFQQEIQSNMEMREKVADAVSKAKAEIMQAEKE